ncbi:MAG: ATP-binding cassette domain-containing protein [Bacilli bacterium]|nr:ATP-binding cassette domain-containing protein [Bacilli bacterium]
MTSLRLEHIYKVYQGKKKGQEVAAVNDFNLESNKKEFIVFVGPSGCGKSTTLRMIAGLEDITSGKLFIDDELMNRVEPRYRNVAMVFQNYALYPHMTAYDNMAFGLRNMKVPFPKLDESGNPIKGIDTKLIASLKRDAKKMEGDIAKARKAFEKGKELDTKVEEIKNSMTGLEENSKEYKAIKKQYDKVSYELVLENRKSENLSTYEAQLEKINDDIQYFETNPVTLYVDKHFSKEEIDRRIKEAAQILDIEPLLKRLPANMSGGQRQRVALGRAIVRTPKLFLLDEPLSNLDAKLRAQMRVEITKLYDKLDTTFIYVTHDQVEALTMGTRIVVLSAGYVQQIDTPSRLYDFPKNRFVAGFLGTPQMNFYEVMIKKVGEKLHVELPMGNKLDLNLREMRKIEEEYLDGNEHSAILGIRSEDIHIDDKGEFEVKVSITESLGSETLLYSDFDLEKELNIRESTSSIVIKIPGRVTMERNSVVKVNFDKKKIHLFRNDNDKEDSILGEE